MMRRDDGEVAEVLQAPARGLVAWAATDEDDDNVRKRDAAKRRNPKPYSLPPKLSTLNPPATTAKIGRRRRRGKHLE
eukprot:357281-Rhodomonas_salina.2